MTAGRKAKPTALKRLEGNPGKRALNSKEPKPTMEIPECPDHLKGAALAEWKRITVELQKLGILTKIDRAALVAYCTAWGDYVYACTVLNVEDDVIQSLKGGRYQNPWVAIKNGAMDRMVRIAAEFGMTPASRTRVKVEAPSEEEEMEGFLFGNRNIPAKVKQ
jgi:P27 family predicted phage terminase small subunit